MKASGLIRALCGIAICCCYLSAVVGYDIHVDHHDGTVFVVSLLERTDCAHLHPEDECHCIEHSQGECEADDEDCENLTATISITGTHCDYSFLSGIMPAMLPAFGCRPFPYEICGAFPHDFLLHSPPDNVLSMFCILRV